MLRIFLSLVFAGTLTANGLAQHIHDAHPTTDHMNGWQRISLTDGPQNPPTVTAGPEVWEVLVDHTEGNATCTASPVTVSVTKSVTHTCTVGGEISVGGTVEWAAGALFAKCKATASAEVTVNAEYSDTNTETIEISSSNSCPPCEKINYTFKKKKKTATGSVTAYDHKIVCEKGSSTATNYCNMVTLTGSAVGYGETEGLWSEAGTVEPCPCSGGGGDDGGSGGGTGGPGEPDPEEETAGG